MNDKDKEAFEKWELDYFGQNDNCPHYMLHIKNTWQAACEYKQKDYKTILDAMYLISQNYKNLEAKNKKLKDALENCLIMSPLDPFERGDMIREALKEIPIE
jgi:hypothetical protein